MQICILMASPRLNGNTAELCKPFIDELKQLQTQVEYIELQGKDIASCLGCMHCQDISGEYGCSQNDDMQDIVKNILAADVVVYATPIYTWQATPPLKAVMDRMFGLNKFYGKAPREVLGKEKTFALIVTCGYKPTQAADLLDEVMKRGCKHSGVYKYAGMYAVQDVETEDKADDINAFQTKEAVDGARDFARRVLGVKYV